MSSVGWSVWMPMTAAYGMDCMVHVAAAGLFLAPLLVGPDAIRVRRVEIYRGALSPMLQNPIVTSRKS